MTAEVARVRALRYACTVLLALITPSIRTTHTISSPPSTAPTFSPRPSMAIWPARRTSPQSRDRRSSNHLSPRRCAREASNVAPLHAAGPLASQNCATARHAHPRSSPLLRRTRPHRRHVPEPRMPMRVARSALARSLLPVVRHPLSVVRRPPPVARHPSPVARRPSPVARRIQRALRRRLGETVASSTAPPERTNRWLSPHLFSQTRCYRCDEWPIDSVGNAGDVRSEEEREGERERERRGRGEERRDRFTKTNASRSSVSIVCVATTQVLNTLLQSLPASRPPQSCSNTETPHTT
ncbi:hypothetical protein HETIRDRAFT_477601 [Heterobasidion irregulare TC 32-1]|uniref:Uncharacterized protein n=1 Tax=Heterobasidion irregulare (strain TC 32-1) TaxID=747525 RepID=W4K2F8_HETIT|nr:uncharacterized protein HETIRDRAFT_477601 [Heterobasidion irregulare TC 32-1]ETW80008.1 hypothetical protein HETIRDRAFT_477601 [Heterobasidion irregulare TC 32-1]